MKKFNEHLKEFRIREGPFGSDESYGMDGAFYVPVPVTGRNLMVVASVGGGWEHVSVSLPERCPTWEEMYFVKDLFWNEDEVVMQLHPAKAENINMHPYCLHICGGQLRRRYRFRQQSWSE